MPLVLIILSSFLFKFDVIFYVLAILFFEYFYGKIATERILERIDMLFFLQQSKDGFIFMPTEKEIYSGLKKYFWFRFFCRFTGPYNLLTTMLTYNLIQDKTMNWNLILTLLIGTLFFSFFISLGDAIGSVAKMRNFEFKRYNENKKN